MNPIIKVGTKFEHRIIKSIKMIRIITILSISILSFTVKSQVQFKESFKEAQTLAAQSKKTLFVEFTAVWCGPCKLMEKKVFSKPEVGNFINSKFIPVKVDIGTPEGKEFAKAYFVDGVPTMIIMDSNGKVIKRLEGYHSDSQLITQLKNL